MVTDFSLINESNKDFHYKVSQSIVGGPSIVFNQVNIAGETQIRHSENVCRKIQGYDANSLYPYCMQQFLPVNCCIDDALMRAISYGLTNGCFNQSAFEIEFLTYMNHVHKELNYPPIKSKHTEGGREITILWV